LFSNGLKSFTTALGSTARSDEKPTMPWLYFSGRVMGVFKNIISFNLGFSPFQGVL